MAIEQSVDVVLESISDAFFALDRDWRFTYLNRAAERVLRRDRDELLGQVVWEAFPEAVGTLFDREYQRAVVDQVTVGFEAYYPPLNCWFEVRAYPTPGGLSVYFQDVTEHRRIQEEHRYSEERHRKLVETLAQGVVYQDATGRIEYANQAAARILGLSMDALHGLSSNTPAWRATREDGSSFPADEHPAMVALRTGEVVSGVVMGLPNPSTREDRWICINSVPLFRDQDLKPNQVYSVFEDITEARRSVASLRQAKEEAELANRAKDEFIAVLSHELRTPLTPVLLTASLMELHPDLPEDLRLDIATIRRNVELEARLISDLLDLTRIAKGKLELDLADVDIHVVVRMAIDICQREEALHLIVDLGASRHHVRGDSTRLQQVFWNLINNAQKFAKTSGTITVKTQDGLSGWVRVSVSDDGVGIDPEILPKIFDAFEQGNVRASRMFAGLGLGLAISKKLVNAQGGTITAESEGKDRGATFLVEFPTVEAPALPTQKPPESMPSTQSTTAALSVLLVEDHPATARALARLIALLGHQVSVTTSVSSALATCNQQEFDLILSDLGLPDGSGIDLMRQLRSRYEGRAIALTGYGMESDIRASYDAGFAEHLTKPVDPDILEVTILRVIAAAPQSRP